MDNFKIFLKKIAAVSVGVATFTIISARDFEFYINDNIISFKEEPFLFLLIMILFALIPLMLAIGSSVLHVGCDSTKNHWLSRKSRESAEGYEKARKDNEEYNS